MEQNSFQKFIDSINIQQNNYHELILKWTELMKPYKNSEIELITSNSLIIDFKYDNKHYVVTDNDIERTRIKESEPYPNFRQYLKQLLVFYCEKNKIKYKQGINEIMGVFLLMKFINEKIELYEVYNVFALFIDLFFCNYYYQKEIYALNSSCSLIQLLLRYHEPD